ncbi:sel1 repeat family protein [Desulfovibrio sp. OttesenSCG-928-I05]|nr:sel1 repeat family protein [Desulfovibrio sp. OttesenSCG-928-I05]
MFSIFNKYIFSKVFLYSSACIVSLVLCAGNCMANQPEDNYTGQLIVDAMNGNSLSQLHLCRAYINGEGVAEDLSKAAQWCQKSAEQGNGFAQELLAFMYERGAGVEKDRSAAIRWYQKAAANGNEAAQKSLERLNVAPSSAAPERPATAPAAPEHTTKPQIASKRTASPQISTERAVASQAAPEGSVANLVTHAVTSIKNSLPTMDEASLKASIALPIALVLLLFFRMSTVFILSLPVWYFYPQQFLPFMVAAFCIAIIRSIIAVIRYKKHGVSLFALSYSEGREYHETGGYIVSAVSEFERAEKAAENAGISKNKDGSFNRRSAAGKRVQAALDTCSVVEKKYVARHNTLHNLPQRRWEKKICDPFSFIFAPLFLGAAWHYIVFQRGYLLGACFAVWLLYWIVQMLTCRFMQKFIPKPYS